MKSTQNTEVSKESRGLENSVALPRGIPKFNSSASSISRSYGLGNLVGRSEIDINGMPAKRNGLDIFRLENEISTLFEKGFSELRLNPKMYYALWFKCFRSAILKVELPKGALCSLSQ